jgi:putative endonuclease
LRRRDTGILGEKIALNFLKKRGYRILETNYRCRYGEIDIVSLDREYLVFVEVRTKSSNEFGSPEDSITAVKRKRLVMTAMHYLQNRDNLPPCWRIDVVAIELDRTGNVARIELIDSAICEES